MAVPSAHFTLHPTQYTKATNVYYARTMPSMWRFVHVEDGMASEVGPQYPTKDTLLADLLRYMTQWGVQ